MTDDGPEGLPVQNVDGETATRMRDFMRARMGNQVTEEELFWLCSGLITGIVSSVREIAWAAAIDRRLGEEGMTLETRIGVSPAFPAFLNIEGDETFGH